MPLPASGYFLPFPHKEAALQERGPNLCHAFHDYRPFVRAAADAESVAKPHDPAGFGAGAVDFNFPAGHGLCCESAGLEEARRPLPFVDANGFAGLFNLLVVHRVVFVQGLSIMAS